MLLWSLVFGAWCFSARAQTPLSNLVYSVGTTIRDNSNQDWSYVLLDTDAPQILAGKRFAVYGKPGYPTNAGAFTLRGNLVQAPDVTAINSKLNQSVALGQNLASLNDALASAVGTNVFGLLRKVPGITNQTLPQKVLSAFQKAATDVPTAEMLALLEHGNPGLTICAGHAFSELIGTITTYEVRELDPVSGAAGDVVGRVTLVPNAPVVLPAPGRPFQVVSNQMSEHLLIRLRWGTPAELRRLSVLNVGFNLWRIPKAVAEAGNFHVTPPTPAQLHGNANFVQANRAAVFAPMDYNAGSGAGAADDPADRITFFFADSGRGSSSPPFTDGEQFYYFATARDLLGRDGLVSPGGLARACRRLTPKQPTDVKVVNTVLPGSTNQPRLQVNWVQNTNAADLVTHYWIYRWPNPTMALTNDATPLNFRVGVVTNVPGTNFNSFIDTGIGALTNANITNAWFTVRAVSVAACDPLLSPHAGPAWGVLRQRDAPDVATGSVIGSCGTPVVMFQSFVTNTITVNTQAWSLRLTCQRRDRGIAWVTFTVTNYWTGTQTVGPVYFPPDDDLAPVDFEMPSVNTYPPEVWVTCTVGTQYGQTSQPASSTFVVPIPPGKQKEIVFYAGQLLSTALNSSDPLLTELNQGSTFCLSPYSAVPDVNGMVAIHLDITLGSPILIQALTNNTWYDVAVVTPDANSISWVSFPACLIGPLPQFRGCRVNQAMAADCDQHVARAADSGEVAPLRVRFTLTPRTREYRVYRRADQGPLTLVAQGAGAYDPAKPTRILEVRDDTMPSSPTRLCYFVQLLDEHGSGSPLSFIGCKEVKPDKLPRPVLSEPIAIGSNNNAQVTLNWFCPTAGVSRFQFKISRTDSPKPSESSGFASPKVTHYPVYNTNASYLGLKKKSSKYLPASFLEAHWTSRIGAGFGPGPQFTINATVIPNATYSVCVAAVDDQGNVGDASDAWEFSWKPPVVLPTVPWPARPLPPVRDFDTFTTPSPSYEFNPRVAAVVLFNDGGLLDRRYPVLIRIGELVSEQEAGTVLASNVGNTNYVHYSRYGSSSQNPDPNPTIFRSRSPDSSRAGQPLLPIAIYRQQITNDWFPKVSGDLTQVSPLIERIPWRITPNGQVITIPDRLFANYYETKDALHYYNFLYLRDLQPVVAGAAYEYFVVRFDAKREVQEVVPAGLVTIPQNP
ncbi:MAG: hypothetical protein EXS35_04220 [Pedosphaera sp.]|nr:hypothetical protein [Pedosphaera sp.]